MRTLICGERVAGAFNRSREDTESCLFSEHFFCACSAPSSAAPPAALFWLPPPFGGAARRAPCSEPRLGGLSLFLGPSGCDGAESAIRWAGAGRSCSCCLPRHLCPALPPIKPPLERPIV